MKFRWNIFNVSSIIFCFVVVFYTIYNYKVLSEGEGWGVVAMIGLFGLGVIILAIDFILQFMFKKNS